MQKYNFYSNRTDLSSNEKGIYKTINIQNINNEDILIKEIINTLDYFFHVLNITKKNHIFIVGLGNENNTADSVGPKTLKFIKVNAFLDNMGYKIQGNKISALEPGVLGETGILTNKIIKSVVDEIKPNLVILIDSFIDDKIESLNKKIEINNIGLKTGTGIIGLSSDINQNTLGIPIIVIGVTTAIELFIEEKAKNYYLLTSKNIDSFVLKIAKIIGKAINKAIDNLN